jgi:hypothetical protein
MHKIHALMLSANGIRKIREQGNKTLAVPAGSASLDRRLAELPFRGRTIFNGTLFIADLKPDHREPLGKAVD